jgi:creatinine amidohydrolase
MRPYILAETNWYALKDQRFELAILPWGATEAHNFHLPYSTDNIESDLIAAESARIAWEKGARPIVLPTLPFGVNTGQRDIYLDINLNPSTQFAILHDIIDVLAHQKVYKLLIFNSHGGNDFKQMLRELGLKFPNMFLSTCNWYKALERKKYFEYPGDHAEEMETSLMLYLRPDLVLPKDKWGDGLEKKNKIAAFSEGWAWTERKWPQITADTGIGNPVLASKEKGERYFRDLTNTLGNFFFDLCKVDSNSLFE